MRKRSLLLLCSLMLLPFGGGRLPSARHLLADDRGGSSLSAEQRTAARRVAEGHLARGAPELALELLEPLRGKAPDDPEIALRFAEALIETGRFEEALDSLAVAVHAPELRIAAEILNARAFVRTEDRRSAVRAIDRAWQAGFRALAEIETIPDLVPLLEDPHYLFLLDRLAESWTPFRSEIQVHHTLRGRAAHEHFGWSVVEVGDCDGDGANDLAVSAPFARSDEGGAERGRVELWSSRTGERILEVLGPVDGGRFGHALGKFGDLDGDGTPDIIVGAPGSETSAGRVQVHSGRDGALILESVSETIGDGYGTEARGVGDWNRDGAPDLLIGIPGADGLAGAEAGRVELRSGRDLSLLLAFEGEQAGERLGSAAWGAARADGHFLVLGAGRGGAAGSGEARLYRGEEGRLLEVVESDGTGVALGESSVALVGDVDGDGVPDFSISDWQNRARGKWTGRVVVHSGANGTRLRTLTGSFRGGFGTGSLVAGDVDLDGHADLIVGAWLSSRGASSGGAAFLISGATSEILATWSGRTVGDHIGIDATGLGDIDGDGALDFAIAAANSSILGPDTGRVFIVSGPCLLRGEYPANLAGETRQSDAPVGGE